MKSRYPNDDHTHQRTANHRANLAPGKSNRAAKRYAATPQLRESTPIPWHTLPGAQKPANQDSALPDPFDWRAMYYYRGSDNSPARDDVCNTSHHQQVPGIPQAGDQAGPLQVEETVTIDTVRAHLNKNSWDVDSLAEKLTDSQMKSLSASDRIRLIHHIAHGSRVGNDDEQTIIRLLASTSVSQAAAVRRQLAVPLLQQLESAINGEQHRDYHLALRKLFFHSQSPKEAHKAMATTHHEFPWADPGIIHALVGRKFHYEQVELKKDGKLHVQYWSNFLFLGLQLRKITLNPYEMIRVRFHYPEEHDNAGRGQVVYMPAINLRSLKQKQLGQDIQTAVDVGLIAGGGVGLMTATTRLHRAIASADVALGLADIAIRDFRHEIAKSQAGRDFLQAWDIASTLITVYGLARVMQQAPGIIRSVRQTFLRLRNAPPPKGLGKIEAHVDDMLSKADAAQEAVKSTPQKPLNQPPRKISGHQSSNQELSSQFDPAPPNTGIMDHSKSHDRHISARDQATATKQNTNTAKSELGPGDVHKAHASGEAGLLADLDADGMLNLYIKRGPNSPSGSQMFQEALEAFGSNVKGIRGNWINSKSIGDNFKSYKKALSRGHTPERAAFETFTGKMAQKNGFDKARVTKDTAERVTVEFTR